MVTADNSGPLTPENEAVPQLVIEDMVTRFLNVIGRGNRDIVPEMAARRISICWWPATNAGHRR